MKVEVDRDVCAASGVCMMIAPDVFEPDDEGYARVSAGADGGGGGRGAADAVRRAELNCPAGAIRVQAS
jgi:ferredoxin